MKKFIYKWLPIIMGCHQRADRSFYYHGEKFPVCARCTGIILGFFLSLVLYWLIKVPFIILICLLVPMIVDGTIQQCSHYESTNFRRFVTGAFFGFAFTYLLMLSFYYTFLFGRSIGLKYYNKI